MREYAFHKPDDQRPRLAFAVVPARRLLRRLLRPTFLRQEKVLRDLGETLDHLAASCAALERRHEELVRRHEDLAQRWGETNHLAVHLHEVWAETNHLVVNLHEVWAENNHKLVMGHQELRQEVSQAILQMEQDTSAVAAIGWDHVAVARRLAGIEDRLNGS